MTPCWRRWSPEPPPFGFDVCLMRHVSTFVQSPADVIDDLLRLYDLAIIFAHLPPVPTDQDHIDQVADRAVWAPFPAQLEAGERAIDISRGSGQELPALLVCSLLLRVFAQLGGTVMLGIDRDRNNCHLPTEVGSKPKRDVRQLCSLHQARPWA
jgi:hypothetical protein